MPRFLIQHFSSNEDAQNWMNSEKCNFYDFRGVSDTNDYITIVMERKPQA